MRCVTRPHPITAERLVRHGFATRPAADVVAAARVTTAIQAQDGLQARLGLRSRGTGFTDTDVVSAMEQRLVVRTWLMRATIHLVAARDVRWLTRLLGPTFARRFRKRWLDIGLTPAVLARTADALPAVLVDGPLTKTEIVTALRARGVTFPMDDPQAPIHVLLHATGLGLICRATDRGRDATFALLDTWVPRNPDELDDLDDLDGDDALAELARRYFTAFGPATAADFSTWSGLPSGRAIELVRDELDQVDVDGRPGFRSAGSTPTAELAPGSVRLLAGFDNYLVGYRDRGLFVAEQHRSSVYVGGVIKPTVLVDGRIAGIWRLTRTARSAAVTVTPFDTVAPPTRRALLAEVADIERFLATPTELTLAHPA